MIELWLAVRDSIGLNSTLIYQDEPILIKDLPTKAFHVYRAGIRIADNIGANILPGFLLDYCAAQEQAGERFEGRTPAEIISKLQLKLEAA